MLTTAQAGHFTTFGFAVLRGFLADRAALRAEADAAIRDAYAATYDERVIDGISGHYLPMAARRTPVSASLVCDDPRFIDAAEQLLGGPVIPECPEGVLYFAEAGWHTDDGIGVRGVGRADVRRGVHPAWPPRRGTRGRPGPAGRAERGTEHDLLISQARTAPGIRLAAWIPVCPVRAARQARRSTLSACALLEPADVARLVVSCARRCAAGLLRLGRSSPKPSR